MEIAKYFASLGIRVSKQDQKKVDTFLGNLEKGLKGNVKGTNDLEKAVKKETKTTVDGLVQKEQKTKALNKQVTVAAKNQRAWNKEFAYSLKMMTSKPLSKSALKAQQGVYDQLFGAVTPRAMVGATGANQRAWNTRFKQQIAQMSATGGGISRRARQEQLNAAFGAVGSNPRVAGMLNQRLAHLQPRRSDALSDMAAYYRNEQQVAALKERSRRADEASTNRLLSLRKRELEQRIYNTRRLALIEQRSATLAASRSSQVTSSGGTGGRSSASYGRANYLHAGGAAGAFARYGLSSLPLVGGVFGASAMNRANQEAISARLTTQAVVEAQGLTGQGPAAFDWLRNQGNRIGFSYMDQAQDYNNFLSNSLGAGLSLGGSQDIYLGFAEYSKAMGITPARQKLVMNALSQMQGKGVVSMEELRRQMAESMPGTMSVFAEAYQTMTGGGLQGQEALAALMEAVPTGTVESAKLLPIVAELMRKRAAPKLDIAMKTSQAEQGRLQNIQSDLMMAASGAGVESGFTRMFKSLTAALKESEPLVLSMARGFDTMSRYASSALLSVQSITRFFQGRDSLLGDKLFPDEESQAKAFLFLEQFKSLMTEMDKLTMNIYNGWKMLLGELSSNKILDTFNTSLSIMANTAATFNRLAAGDFSGAVDAAGGAGMKYANAITAPGRSGANALLSTFTDRRIPTPFSDADSQLDWQANYRAEQARMAAAAKNQYALPGINQPLNGMQSTNLEIKMDVQINAANPEDFNSQFQDKFKSVIESTMMQYSQKE